MLRLSYHLRMLSNAGDSQNLDSKTIHFFLRKPYRSGAFSEQSISSSKMRHVCYMSHLSLRIGLASYTLPPSVTMDTRPPIPRVTGAASARQFCQPKRPQRTKLEFNLKPFRDEKELFDKDFKPSPRHGILQCKKFCTYKLKYYKEWTAKYPATVWRDAGSARTESHLPAKPQPPNSLRDTEKFS
jgi:hypothetical protein